MKVYFFLFVFGLGCIGVNHTKVEKNQRQKVSAEQIRKSRAEVRHGR